MEHTYKVEQRAAHRFFITYDHPNSKGEQLAIEFSLGSGYEGKHSLPYLWFKEGYTDHILETYWSAETYATNLEQAYASDCITQQKKGIKLILIGCLMAQNRTRKRF